MSRRDRGRDAMTRPLDDEELGRLLESAGPRPPLPAEDLDAIAAAARAAWREQTVRRSVPRRKLLWPTALAAALVALLLAMAWWRVARPELPAADVASVEAVTGPLLLEAEGEPPRALEIGDTLRSGAVVRTESESTDSAPRAALRLANGVALRVDAGSRLRLASASALELLTGALYADTDGAAAGSSLEVATPMGTARDLGTRFAVRLAGRPPDLELVVVVRDGTVAVDRDGASWVAAAGQELLLREDGSMERRQVPAHGPGWEWVVAAGAGFEIGGRTPWELLDWMARETGWEVRFEDDTVERTARAISFEAGDSAIRLARPEQGLSMLPTARLEGELHDGTLLVRRLR